MKTKHLFVGVLMLLNAINASADFVGITYDEFNPHYTEQHDPMWCWAASTQMVLSYQGVKIPQEKIIMRVTGKLSGSPGSVPDMINAANGLFENEGAQVVMSGQYVLGAPLATVLYNQMKNKHPVILNYLTPGSGVGHAIVVTGVDATIVSGQVMVSSIFVFDPFPFKVSYDAWGKTTLIHDPSLRSKQYPLMANPTGVYIPAGIITGVILVDGTKL